MKKLKVGYCYNNIIDFPRADRQPLDIAAEWTSSQDIETLRVGLESAGFEVIDIGNPQNLIKENVRTKVDIVFSIAEMTGFRYRESIASMLCELYNIPYVLSPPDVLLVALDKHITNLLLQNKGINIPIWHILKSISDFDRIIFDKSAYILKPVAEGSSIGISKDSIVSTKDGAIRRAEYLLKAYKQPVLLQEYIYAKEVTIGVIEVDNRIKALTPVIVNNSGLSDAEYKKKSKESEPIFFLENENLIKKVQTLAEFIFEEIGCKDTARIDFKIDDEENIYFIELNPLTDYTPRKDFCKSAFASGFNYDSLLKTIILNAWKRSHKI